MSYGGCQSLAMLTDDMSRMRWVVFIKTKDEAADGLNQVIQYVDDTKVSALEILGAMGEANGEKGFKRWHSHVESRLRHTHRIFLKEFLSPCVSLATFLVILRAFFWELLTFPKNCGQRPSKLRCISGSARRRASWEARLLSRHVKVNHSVGSKVYHRAVLRRSNGLSLLT